MPSDEAVKAVRTVLEARWKESAGPGYYPGTRTDIDWRWQEWWIAMEAFIPACATLLDKMMAQVRADATEQCAIEAGERSPEGVSSHTMLGDMWDERILRERLAGRGK